MNDHPVTHTHLWRLDDRGVSAELHVALAYHDRDLVQPMPEETLVVLYALNGQRVELGTREQTIEVLRNALARLEAQT